MDKLWLQHYPKDVPHEINPEQYPSLNELFMASIERFQDHNSFISMGNALSFRQLEDYSRHLAAYLQKLQLPKGSRVALMMPNILQYPIAIYAILRAGLTVVNTNPLYTADELVYQLNDAQAQTIIVLSKFTSTLEEARPKLPSLKHIIITEIGDIFPLFKRHLINFLVRHCIDRKTSSRPLSAISFRDALNEGRKEVFHAVSCQPNDIAFLQYTGGTTGVSKAAMLSHRNLIANILQASTWIQSKKFDHTDLIITALPLYHIFSLLANCLTFLYLGVPNVLIVDPRDTKRLLKQIHKTPPTAITGVNTLYSSLVNHSHFNPNDFSNLKIALSGGMALNKTVADLWIEKTHKPIIEAYGLTEASPAVAINLLNQTTHEGSIGLPLSSTEISIRDSSGNECALGETGELCVRGPQVMQGYWHHPEETALVFWPDHFLRTGDCAYIDPDGFIHLVDRIKDMIIISGFNVYPNEVEHVISQMPQVLEVGVIGVLSKSGNEKIKACIVKRDPSLTVDEVIAYCHRHLTSYKVPKIVSFYSELPKTNVGKILRRMLE